MAISTDPLQRDQIGIASRDTGARLEAPTDNAALQLARGLAEVQPALTDTLTAVAQQKQSDAEARARQAAIETSGAQLSDAVRMGQIKPTQNPWFVSAYNREAAAIRSNDQLSQLQTASEQWAEKSDPVAFANKWHTEVAGIAKNYTDPDEIKGFLASEAQASQQTLATNQAYNSQRMVTERQQNLSALAADALQRVVQAGGGHVSGSAAAAALAPAKAQWIATGGSLEDWNKIAISAVTTASYSIRSPGLLDLLKDPALINGPRQNDTSSYGDGTDDQTPDVPKPLQPVNPAEAQPPTVSTGSAMRLQPPAMGPISNTFAQHEARGSAGVDIKVPMGTNLVTPIGGIAHVGYQKGKGGLFVEVTSPDGKLVQVLAHLSLAQVQDGQQVTPGMVIGKSGRSGDATGPHVHWQLKVDGKQVDPTSYEVAQQGSDDQHAEVEAGNAPAALAPTPSPPDIAAQPQHNPEGPSLYDMAGVADSAEQDRYRISSAIKSEAGDKLAAIVNQRKLDGLAASDRLYATFGTGLLTGDVPLPKIIATLKAAGYSPQVSAAAIDNIQNAVSTSASLSNARLSMANSDPSHAKHTFDLEVEGRTQGWSQDYESRVGNAVIAGDISADDGARMVGQAVSRTESQQSEARAQTSFDERQNQGIPGQTIKKASDIKRGIDIYTNKAVAYAERLVPSSSGLNSGAARLLKNQITARTLSYLADHPNDYAGAEQSARDYVAAYLESIAAHKGKPLHASPPTATAAGGNPRR